MNGLSRHSVKKNKLDVTSALRPTREAWQQLLLFLRGAVRSSVSETPSATNNSLVQNPTFPAMRRGCTITGLQHATANFPRCI